MRSTPWCSKQEVRSKMIPCRLAAISHAAIAGLADSALRRRNFVFLSFVRRCNLSSHALQFNKSRFRLHVCLVVLLGQLHALRFRIEKLTGREQPERTNSNKAKEARKKRNKKKEKRETKRKKKACDECESANATSGYWSKN
jgi:hypothetical protein